MLSAGREEMLRLGLKPDSEVHHDDDGTVRIVLHVDEWLWLVPLISSFGSDVAVEEPADYRNDDSRLRSTRGRNPRSVGE